MQGTSCRKATHTHTLAGFSAHAVVLVLPAIPKHRIVDMVELLQEHLLHEVRIAAVDEANDQEQ